MLLVLVLMGALMYESSLLGQDEPKHATKEEAKLEEKAKKLKEAVDVIKKINKSQEKRKQISKEEYERIKRWLINKKLKRSEVGEVQFNKMANKGKLGIVPKVQKVEHLSVPRIEVNFGSTGRVWQSMFIQGAPTRSIRFQKGFTAADLQLPNFGKLMSVTVSQEETTYRGNLKPVSKAVAHRQLSEFTALDEEVQKLFSSKEVCYYDEIWGSTITSKELKKACEELGRLNSHFSAKIERLNDNLSELTPSEFNKEVQELKYCASALIKKLDEVKRLNNELKNLSSKLLSMQGLIAGVTKGIGVFSLLSPEQRKGLFIELTNKYKNLVNKLVLNSATEKFFKFSSEYETLPEFSHSKQTERKQATFEEVYEESKIMLRINKIVDFRKQTDVAKGLFNLLTKAENSALSNLPDPSVEELVVGSCKRLLGGDVALREDWQVVKEAINNLFTREGKINQEADFLYFTRGEAKIRQCLEDTLPIKMTKWFKGCMVEEEKEEKKELTEIKTYNHIFLIMKNLYEILNSDSKVENKAKDKSNNTASSLCKCSASTSLGTCLSYNPAGEIPIYDVLNTNFKLNVDQANCLAEKIRNDNCRFAHAPFLLFESFFQECNTNLFESVRKKLIETDNCFAPLLKHQEEIFQAYLNWYNGCNNPLFHNLLKSKYKFFESVTNILLGISLEDGFKLYFDDEKMKEYACFIWLYAYLTDLFNKLEQEMKAVIGAPITQSFTEEHREKYKERYEELRGLCIHKVEGDKGLRKEIESILDENFSSGCTAAEIYSRLQIKDISKIKKILDYITAIKNRLLANLSPPQCSLIETEANCTEKNTKDWCIPFLGKCFINCQKLKDVNECNSTQDWCSWWKGKCSISCEKVDKEEECKKLVDKCKWHLNSCIPNCEALGKDDCAPDKTSQRCYLYYGEKCWPYSTNNVIRTIGLERILDFCKSIGERDCTNYSNTNGLCLWMGRIIGCGINCYRILREDCKPEKTRGQCSFKYVYLGGSPTESCSPN